MISFYIVYLLITPIQGCWTTELYVFIKFILFIITNSYWRSTSTPTPLQFWPYNSLPLRDLMQARSVLLISTGAPSMPNLIGTQWGMVLLITIVSPRKSHLDPTNYWSVFCHLSFTYHCSPKLLLCLLPY